MNWKGITTNRGEVTYHCEIGDAVYYVRCRNNEPEMWRRNDGPWQPSPVRGRDMTCAMIEANYGGAS